MCKKKGDVVDGDHTGHPKKSSWKIGNIINRINLKPTAWKSESQLNQKQTARLENDANRKGESIFYTKPLSKSSDWTEVDLEVPLTDDDPVHLRNPKLSLIFDKEDGTPTPPPRKNHKGPNLREKIEKIARNGLQAFHGDKSSQKPVEEPILVKKKINYVCPQCDDDEAHHNRDHHHHNHQRTSKNSDADKEKRKKNLSVVSLPNYTDLKLSIASPDGKSSSKPDLNSSRLSLQGPASKKLTASSSTGRLDAYITRCRSFGSLLPQQLKKLKQPKLDKKEDVTSDDSFGPLEDWDLGLIEHYNPKDTSLPRPRKHPLPKAENEVLSGIESLIVKEEEIEPKPKPPVRRNESLVKKKAQIGSQQGNIVRNAPEESCLTPPPSPETKKIPIPAKRTFKEPENDNDHSGLMRILQEFSIKDKEQKEHANAIKNNPPTSLTPSLVEFERALHAEHPVEDFINAEKNHTRALLS